ncbi:MAG: ParB/RepB/Spo0J family partition protein [Alphaproteobacteria bacterium]|nr:ParB/RepB/Spo0J family partition protein [Alphaproteobacteria bacterium]
MLNKNLGRGLSALLGDMDDYVSENNLPKSSNEISIDSLKPGRMQPRHYFNEEKMQTLIESVRQKGVLQPLLVRETESGYYEIIAGERRWRAAKEAGLSNVPVIIVACNDREALELGLIENLQRDDLNPMEEAESLHKLLVDHQKTQEEIAFSISKSRSYVANTLRLMQLPEEVKNLLREGKLTAGHARSILNSNNIEELAKRIVNEKLSVRAAEHLVKKHKTPTMMGQPIIDPDVQALADRIGEAVSMKTKLQINRNGGMLTLYFQQFEQLDDLMNKLQN